VKVVNFHYSVVCIAGIFLMCHQLYKYLFPDCTTDCTVLHVSISNIRFFHFNSIGWTDDILLYAVRVPFLYKMIQPNYHNHRLYSFFKIFNPVWFVYFCIVGHFGSLGQHLSIYRIESGIMKYKGCCIEAAIQINALLVIPDIIWLLILTA
jgi:hypothetical protein